MALHSSSQKFIDEFFAAIAPFEAAFQGNGFSYLAVKVGDRFIIKQGRLFLNTYTPNAVSKHFRSPRIRAGHYRMTELKIDLRGFIERLVDAGALDTPDGALHFPSADGGHHAASFIPFHPDGLQTQTRYNFLTLMGGQMEPLPQPEIDWEIKAAPTPYDGVQELANEFVLGALTGDTINVGIVAYNVAAIDAKNSKVEGTNAEVNVLLASGLSTERVLIGYRGYVPGAFASKFSKMQRKQRWTRRLGAETKYIKKRCATPSLERSISLIELKQP